MEGYFLFVFIVIITVFLYTNRSKKNKSKRINHIDQFRFPKKIREKVKEKYNHLSEADLDKVEQGLKEWFYVCHIARAEPVCMPSQVIDVAWHEFILFTKLYQSFCKSAFGKFLHHHPAESMHSDRTAQEGIKTVWKIACARERISKSQPKRLPILFGLDARLKISDGFKYSLNCDGPRSNGFCATHIGCSAIASCSTNDCYHRSNECDSSGSNDSGCGGGGD
jgi:hypothetical protein